VARESVGPVCPLCEGSESTPENLAAGRLRLDRSDDWGGSGILDRGSNDFSDSEPLVTSGRVSLVVREVLVLDFGSSLDLDRLDLDWEDRETLGSSDSGVQALSVD
jgi:hypothetical protein